MGWQRETDTYIITATVIIQREKSLLIHVIDKPKPTFIGKHGIKFFDYDQSNMEDVEIHIKAWYYRKYRSKFE